MKDDTLGIGMQMVFDLLTKQTGSQGMSPSEGMMAMLLSGYVQQGASVDELGRLITTMGMPSDKAMNSVLRMEKDSLGIALGLDLKENDVSLLIGSAIGSAKYIDELDSYGGIVPSGTEYSFMLGAISSLAVGQQLSTLPTKAIKAGMIGA